MKYFLAWLVGALLGAGAALAALYFNPLTQAGGQRPLGDPWTLTYDFPGGSMLALTHDGQLGLPHIPADIPPLWEAAIDHVALSVLRLEDANGGPSGLASRVSVLSQDTDFLLRGFVVSDYWLITVPGQGTLYLESENNLWPFLKDTLIPVKYLQREWRGPVSYSATVGPRFGSAAEIFGVSGEFAGARGSAREIFDLDRFSAAHGIEALRGTLALELEGRGSHDASEGLEAARAE
jgi:hypothetical protein